MSRSESAIFLIASFGTRCQNLQTSFFTFVMFAMRSILSDRHTRTHTETGKPVAIGEILQICLKAVVSLNEAGEKLMVRNSNFREGLNPGGGLERRRCLLVETLIHYQSFR